MKKAAEAEEALPRLEADRRVSQDSHLKALPCPHPHSAGTGSGDGWQALYIWPILMWPHQLPLQ